MFKFKLMITYVIDGLQMDADRSHGSLTQIMRSLVYADSMVGCFVNVMPGGGMFISSNPLCVAYQ